MKEYIDFILKKEKKSVDRNKIYSGIEKGFKRKLSEKEKNEINAILDKGIKSYEYYLTPNGRYKLLSKTSFRKVKFHCNRLGDGFVIIDNSFTTKDGKRVLRNEKFNISRENCNNAVDGDTVIVDIGGKDGAIVTDIIDRNISNVVCEVIKNGKTYALRPLDKRKGKLNIKLNEELPVGSIVSVSLDEVEENCYNGNVLKVYKNNDGVHSDVLLEAFKCGMPDGFSEATLKQIESIPDCVLDEEKNGRWDFTNCEVFSIDGDDTKDKDDAISLEALSNGNYLLGVHIADVAHYVEEGTPLDKDAFIKGTSYYFGGLVEPQLPPKLSNGICSLDEGVERLTKSILIEIDKNGNVVSRKLVPSVIKSNISMTYNKVNDLLNGKEVEGYMRYKDTLRNMSDLAAVLRKKRIFSGAIIFNKPEIMFNYDDMGKPIEVVERVENIADIMIEEFMLQANIGVSRILTEDGIPCVYRIHDVPNYNRLDEFMKLLSVINMPFDYDTDEILKNKELLQTLVLHVSKNKKLSYMLNTNLVRCMSHASYSTVNIGHYGIGANSYCHFTSPIRRIADLAISRMIDQCYFEKNINIKTKNIKKWQELADDFAVQASKMEKVEEEVEKNVLYMDTASYMSDFIGQEFFGTIITLSNNGICVQLDNLLEGRVRNSNLDGDYIYNPSTFTLVSLDGRGNFYVGDRLKLRLSNTSIDTKNVDFKVIEKINENTIRDSKHSNQYVKSIGQLDRKNKAYLG